MILTAEETIREFTEKGYWGTQTVLDLLYEKAAANADQEALVDPYNKGDLVGTEPARLTYSDVIRRIDRLALQFLDWGVKRDDIIIVQLPNIMELTLTIFAAARVGAVISPIPVQWRGHEIKHAVELTDAVLCVTSHSFMGVDHIDLFRASLPSDTSVRHYVTVGAGSADGAVNMADILEKKTDEAEAANRLKGLQSGANDILTICWTSGTEAAAKAVPRSHNHWLAISRAVVESFLKPDQECTYLSLFPTINMAGLGAVLIPWVMTGGKMILHHPFDLGIFLKQLIGEKVYYTLAPPALLDNLAKSSQWAEMDKGALKVIGSGSAPLSTWMVKTFHDFGIDIVNFFASNEGVCLYSCPADFPTPEDRARFFPRFGRQEFEWQSKATKGIQTRLVDPTTEAEILEPGVVGELRVKGATVFPGYYKQPELTANAFDEAGYFRSGDLFTIEGDQNEKYCFHGRFKDLIIRGGVNISPEEIEAMVVAHPKVAEVAAVGYPDPRLNERICIAVVPLPQETVTLEEINDFLKEKGIAKYKYPEKMVLFDELPRNPVNKVLKREIRKQIISQSEA
jgi:acyl-CoA synthetase (AMP-forming)/AMP-acid ligase II